MSTNTIKENIIYSTILAIANYVFPFITYPYISRVLGVENIGACNFADSIVNYFMLFSMMGINVVGVREIAKAKGNDLQLNRVYNSLFILNAICTAIAVVALVSVSFAVPQLYEYKELIFLGALRIAFNFLQVEWLFKGVEDFKYITIRSVCIRSIFVAAVFMLVREKDDYVTYFAVMSVSVVVNAIVNLFYSRHFVNFSPKVADLKIYLKPFTTIGLYLLLTSMYTTFNVVFLGFVYGDEEVGYFTTATKLYNLFLSLYTAFTGVMLPRLSSVISKGRNDEFVSMYNRSNDILMRFAMPIIAFSLIMAPQIIRVISGSGYENAIFPMRIIMPLIFIVGYEQILVIQTLMPLNKDKIIFRNSVIGALCGVLFNLLFVFHFKSVGSSIALVLSECVILVFSQIAVKKYINQSFPYEKFFIEILKTLPLAIMLIIESKLGWGVTGTIIFALIIFSIHILAFNFSIIKSLVNR